MAANPTPQQEQAGPATPPRPVEEGKLMYLKLSDPKETRAQRMLEHFNRKSGNGAKSGR